MAKASPWVDWTAREFGGRLVFFNTTWHSEYFLILSYSGFTSKTVTNSSSSVQTSSAQHNGTAAGTSDSVSGDKFAQDILRAHNEYRAKHGSPPLVYDSKVSADMIESQIWLETWEFSGILWYHEIW